MKIFLSSHGHLASGIKSSLDILIGNSDKLTIFDAYVDETNLTEKLDEFYEKIVDDEQVILLSDLYGGSVNQQMVLYANRPNTTLIAGVNLALVLELTIAENLSKESIEEIVDQSRSMMRIVDISDEKSETEDDFF
ncbi:MAG: PTS sugar transporter subunit IIA [Erysipelotrichaceae bacterium]|nr:PTS sugar transporter subunit IIA [Erysipelotrichaceae bacterium]MDY5252930.1 PTS sugar transporter subunit IIA [Erysipelotrichaceae bacterium]